MGLKFPSSNPSDTLPWSRAVFWAHLQTPSVPEWCIVTGAKERNDREDTETRTGFEWLRTAVGAIGVLGSLAAFGYICSFARDEFLGVRPGLRGTPELATIAGEFLVKSSFALIQQAWDHWFLALVYLVAFMLLIVAAHVAKRRSQWLAWLSVLSIFGAATASVLVIGLFALPLVSIRNTMIVGVASLPNAGRGSVVDCQANRLWALMVDSRRSGKNDPLALNKSDCAKRHSSEDAAVSLNSTYVLSIVLTSAAWAFLALFRTTRRGGTLAKLTYGVGLMLATVATASLPYLFGKMIDSSLLPRAEILMAAPTEGSSKKVKSPARPKWRDCYVLVQSDKTVTCVEFLNSDSTESEVVEIDREHIQEIAVVKIEDALKVRIDG